MESRKRPAYGESALVVRNRSKGSAKAQDVWCSVICVSSCCLWSEMDGTARALQWAALQMCPTSLLSPGCAHQEGTERDREKERNIISWPHQKYSCCYRDLSVSSARTWQWSVTSRHLHAPKFPLLHCKSFFVHKRLNTCVCTAGKSSLIFGKYDSYRICGDTSSVSDLLSHVLHQSTIEFVMILSWIYAYILQCIVWVLNEYVLNVRVM